MTAVYRRLTVLGCCLLAFAVAHASLAQSTPKRTAALPIDVLVKGPAETDTDLQVICLFASVPANTLHGSLIEMNRKLDGLLDLLRAPSASGGALFNGDFGETLLIAPKAGSLPARRLLLIGLGDARTFTPARMNLVGEIVFHEAARLGVGHPFFAPTVLDGGVSGFPTGDVAQQFTIGALRARDTERTLRLRGESAGGEVAGITFLAGPAHAADTEAGIAKALLGDSETHRN